MTEAELEALKAKAICLCDKTLALVCQEAINLLAEVERLKKELQHQAADHNKTIRVIAAASFATFTPPERAGDPDVVADAVAATRAGYVSARNHLLSSGYTRDENGKWSVGGHGTDRLMEIDGVVPEDDELTLLERVQKLKSRAEKAEGAHD